MSQVFQSAGSGVSVASTSEAHKAPAASAIQVFGLPERLAGKCADFLGERPVVTSCPESPALVVIEAKRLRLMEELANKNDALLRALMRSQTDLLGNDDDAAGQNQLHIELTGRLSDLNTALTAICCGDAMTVRELAKLVHGDRFYRWPEWLQKSEAFYSRSPHAREELLRAQPEAGV